MYVACVCCVSVKLVVQTWKQDVDGKVGSVSCWRLLCNSQDREAQREKQNMARKSLWCMLCVHTVSGYDLVPYETHNMTRKVVFVVCVCCGLF